MPKAQARGHKLWAVRKLAATPHYEVLWSAQISGSIIRLEIPEGLQ